MKRANPAVGSTLFRFDGVFLGPFSRFSAPSISWSEHYYSKAGLTEAESSFNYEMGGAYVARDIGRSFAVVWTS
jgi:hypothetical protein